MPRNNRLDYKNKDENLKPNQTFLKNQAKLLNITIESKKLNGNYGVSKQNKGHVVTRVQTYRMPTKRDLKTPDSRALWRVNAASSAVATVPSGGADNREVGRGGAVGGGHTPVLPLNFAVKLKLLRKKKKKPKSLK